MATKWGLKLLNALQTAVMMIWYAYSEIFDAAVDLLFSAFEPKETQTVYYAE